MKTMTNIMYPGFALFASAYLALSPLARAVDLPPDGGYPGRNAAGGAKAPTLSAEQLKQVVLFAPKPYFPTRARREYKTGAGLFLLNINPETGLVASIKIEKTTRLWSFDVSCLKTFIKWRFKPHTVYKVH